MIHATGLPFFNPLLSVGGVPFPWALPQGSPPASPPSSPVSGASTWPRPQPRAASFTIDAILGRRHHEDSRGLRRDARPSPYSAPPQDQSGGGSQGAAGGAGGSKSKVKRVRTIFTAEQLERLEAEFARQQYMVGPERLYLAAALNLTEAQVKVWFQNRRIKWRKQYMEQQHARLAGASDTSPGLPRPAPDTSTSPLPDLPASPASPDVSLETQDHQDAPQTRQDQEQQQQQDNGAGTVGLTATYPQYLASLTPAYPDHQSEPADLSTCGPGRAK